ncbi:MAG: DUF4249 domain-containing protein [Bacteroidota bacterium]
MKNITLYIVYIVGILFAFSACNLTQEIEIELPEYDQQIMVESYLTPGQPFTLLLSRSFSYFDPFPTDIQAYLDELFVDGAQVTIRYDDKAVELTNELSFNPLTGKLFNYSAGILVPELYETPFELEVITADGERITGTTLIPQPVPIDSVVIEFDNTDTLARALTYWMDAPSEVNFYRRIFAQGTRDSVDFEFLLNDELTDNGQLVVGTNYDFAIGDTIFNTIYHITEDYFDFYNSVDIAEDANGNPFAQPSTILSNVEGENRPLGIFTGLTFDEERTIIEK